MLVRSSLALALCFVSPRLVGAVTVTVDSTADAVDAMPGDGICATAAATCTLRAAIQETNELPGSDTIMLPAGTYELAIPKNPASPGATGALLINDEVTLNGAGAVTTVIDARGLDRALTLDGQVHGGLNAIITISGVTIQNGIAADFGGGIWNRTSDLRLTDVVLRANVTNGSGGGIENSDRATLTNCTVADNVASQWASAPGGAGGGGIWNGGFLVLDGTTVSGNTTHRGGGGGISSVGFAVLRNSTISGNRAATDGGGLFSSYSISTIDVTLTLSNVTVADNVADGEGVGAGDGGGVFLGVGEADVRNTIIAGNVDPGGEAPDCGGQPLTSHGHNLIRNTTGCTLTGDLTGNVTADPLLGPLQNNGGPTKTHALLPGSAARDTGNPAAPGSGGDACLAGDQRAVARPIGAACDIGATESSCGDHVQDPGEQCDDGNLTDGDGCDSSCTTTACGNGVVTTGEECDDGPANGADGCCSSTCTLVDADGDGVCDRDDPCTGTRVITIPHVSVTNLDKAGNESIRVSGETRLPFPINPPLDPLAHGVRFILSGTAGPILDTGIPAVPGVLAQWKVSGSGRRWLYVRLPPGIVRFALLDKSPTVPGLVRFVITGIHFPLALSPSVLPLRMLVVLDGTRTTSAQCAQATPTCTFNATVRRVACK